MHVLLMTKLVFADSSATGQFEFTSLRANCSKALNNPACFQHPPADQQEVLDILILFSSWLQVREFVAVDAPADLQPKMHQKFRMLDAAQSPTVCIDAPRSTYNIWRGP